MIGGPEQSCCADRGGRRQGAVLLAVVVLAARAEGAGRNVETPVPEKHPVLVLVDDMHAGAVRDRAQCRPMVDAVDGVVGERRLRGAPGTYRVRGVALYETRQDHGSVLIGRI